MSTDTVDGLVIMSSDFEPRETMDRFEDAVRASGALVFARIDHSAGAAALGLVLDPIELLIFGSVLTATPLMQARATVGIELPLRALVWEDTASRTWFAYNDPRWLVDRHQIHLGISPMAELLSELAFQATWDLEGSYVDTRNSPSANTSTRH